MGNEQSVRFVNVILSDNFGAGSMDDCANFTQGTSIAAVCCYVSIVSFPLLLLLALLSPLIDIHLSCFLRFLPFIITEGFL